MGRHDTHECQVQKLFRRRVHKKVHLYFNIWLVFFSPILSLSGSLSLSPAVKQRTMRRGVKSICVI